MSKQVYKIPADLNASYGDMEIALQNKDGIGVKPLPIKVILTYIASIVICFYVCTHTFIAAGSFLQIALFVVLWIIMTLLLASYDATKRMQMELIPTLFNYIPKANRTVITRTHSPANDFYSIVGITDIDYTVDKDTGLIVWADGTYGYCYRVVGSASILLFDADKNAIINRVDMFYRKIGTDSECIFITSKEAQKVYRQIANLKRRYDRLDTDDEDLLACADEQFHILRDYVGKSFKSIHQYLIIKADNQEALLRSRTVLQSEVENSSLMIKQCIPLDSDDTNELLRIIYRGKE